MRKPPRNSPRFPEGGFTTTELVVVTAVITIATAGALNFFFGRQELAQRRVVLGHFAEAIRNVDHLPEGNPLSWQATAQVMLAQVMDAQPPTAIPPPGTQGHMLPAGLHAGRTLVDDEALMFDRTGNTVSLSGCTVGDLQITLDPRSLPHFNELRKARSWWIMRSLKTIDPELIITVQRNTLFCCLPRS